MRSRQTVIILVVIAAVVAGIWFLFGRGIPVSPSSYVASAAEPFVVPPIEREYRNDTFRFSLGLPDGFTAAELPAEEGVQTIVLQDEGGHGIQILVTKAGDSHDLTERMVRKDIPDMQIRDVQPVEIGENYRGIAFISDNEAFEGASREVWFFFHGNLYQISTYARLDSLLQAMFATWKFF